MDKREFLKGSGLMAASRMIPKAAMQAMGAAQAPRTNWAGNYTYSTRNLDMPDTVVGLRAVIAGHGHLRALGARHSFNGIADSTEEQVSLERLNSIELDAARRTVTVGAGVRYGTLAPYIDSRGFAVHNLASLPHITVVGACATATHGSGLKNGNLSTAVRGFEIVMADGKVQTFSRESSGDAFAGMVVGLGALGVITRITLAVEPRFDMTQAVYLGLPFDRLERHLVDIFGSGYSVSLFSDWQNHQATQVWIKRRVADGAKTTPPEPEFYGAKLATRKMHPLLDHAAESCTDQGGIPGSWYERMPHFKMNFTPSSGQELQSEYFVPLALGYDAIRAVEQLRDRITPHLFITEFRTIAADELWMSPCYKQDSMTIHFTWKPEWPAVREILPLIEEKLAPFGAKPHWAKLFTMAPERIRAQYSRMADFQALIRKADPGGKFCNEFIQRNLFSA